MFVGRNVIFYIKRASCRYEKTSLIELSSCDNSFERFQIKVEPPYSIGKSEEMDPSTSSTSTSSTAFSDLNDDCLLEVFKHLHLTGLCSAADVCRRFRQNAQHHFASPIFKNDVLHVSAFKLHLTAPTVSLSTEIREICWQRGRFRQALLQVSKLLRNFGFLVKSIKVCGCSFKPGQPKSKPKSKFEKNIFGLISLYCTGSLTELSVVSCDITVETGNTLRPMFLHLHKLSLISCRCSKIFGQTLSFWSPEIRQLKFETNILISDHRWFRNIDDVLRQSFPKLMFFSLRDMSSIKNDDLEEFLKLNTQLKKIRLIGCRKIDVGCFKSMATHVPDIEAIHIGTTRITYGNEQNLESLGKLKRLNTLKLYNSLEGYLSHRVSRTFVTSVLHVIDEYNVPLQHLHVHCDSRFERTEQVVDAILKLKTLRTLSLTDIPRLKMAHILRICKHLGELSELQLQRIEFVISAEDLLEIIKCAPKLQSLYYFVSAAVWDVFKTARSRESNSNVRKKARVGAAKTLRFDHIQRKWTYEPLPVELPGQIDLDAFMKMMRIVRQRKEKARLLIKHDPHITIAANITKGLTRKYNDTLTLEVLDLDPFGPLPFFFFP